MTPNMGMAAPKGTQAPQAGLAALAQPATQLKGKSPENMGEIMALARKMSDAQLADVLQGKSLDVPQFAAMTEAMGRKQLRQAVQGQQAMQQAAVKPPSLKEKLMGEYQQEQMAQMAQAMPQGGGIASLPAPTMAPEGMADGGIVAFAKGDVVEDEDARNPLAFLNPGDLYDKLKGYIKEKQAAVPLTPLQAKLAAEKEKNAPEVVPAAAPAPAAGGVAFDPTAGGNPAVANIPAAPSAASVTGVGTAAGNQPYSIPSFESLQGKKSADYLSKLEGLTEKSRAGLDKIKEQGGGEALMQLAAAVMGSPNLAQAAAKGLPMVASTSAATRKEARAVESAANEYDLNLAKAQEAVEKGDTENQLRYMQLANEAKYRADSIGLQRAQLGQEPNELRTLRAILADPKLAAIYKGGKGAGVISREAALKEWGDLMPSQQKKYGSFNDYYNSINSTMGGGTDLQAQAAAELARRNK